MRFSAIARAASPDIVDTPALASVMRGHTTVVISHRLSLIERADWVIVIDNGRVIEMGTPDELLVSGNALASLFSRVPQEEKDLRESV